VSKLSASALSTFLRSPKSYYWRYKARLEPSQPQVATFDHDKLLGTVWTQYVDRFYRGADEAGNSAAAMNAWLSGTEGWVPDKARDKLTTALTNLMPQYYQLFSPEDGVRSQGSELLLENDRFLGYADGFGDGDILHEVKTTSRSPQISEQLWKIGHSIQVKLYCVLADAAGYQVEIGFKDPPHTILRAPLVMVTNEQKAGWAQELNALAERIESLGDDPNNYPCHPDNCCLTTRGMVSMCSYRDLCDGVSDEVRDMLYKERLHR
jgi:CRISPR/Cas system-associated exonuclease Cas4 (RecB family)